MKIISSSLYTTLCLILSLAATSSLLAQENMTLNRAISVGLANNFGIQISDKNIEIAENNNTWAMAGRTPTVDLVGTLSNNFTKDNNPASFLQGSFYNGSLAATANANWVVYNGGRIKINKEQLLLTIDQQRLNKDTDIHALIRNIYQQYYAVIFEQEQLEVLSTNLAISKGQLSYEETKKEFGSSNAYNLIQFENAVLSDSTAIISQRQAVRTAQKTLYTSLNITDGTEYTFSERLSVQPEAINENKLKNALTEENYTLKSLEIIQRLSILNTQLQEAARKPTISLSGTVGFAENAFKFFADNPNTGDPFPLIFSNRLTGGVSANVAYNLYDGGVRKTNIQSAKLQEEINQISILEAKASLNNQLELLIDNYNNQRQLLDLTNQQIQLAQRNLEISEERFKSGQITSLDFRTIQGQYLNAAYAKVAAIYGLLITKSEIDFLVGMYNEGQ